MVELGKKVRDPISGIEGIAVCSTKYLFGCIRIGVQLPGLNEKGRQHDYIYVDEPQLEVIGEKPKALIASLAGAVLSGLRHGPQPDPPKR